MDGKPRMVKGGVLICNVDVAMCNSLQNAWRIAIAKSIAHYVKPAQVWVNCKAASFLDSNKPSGIVIGGCSTLCDKIKTSLQFL